MRYVLFVVYNLIAHPNDPINGGAFLCPSFETQQACTEHWKEGTQPVNRNICYAVTPDPCAK